MNFKDKVMGILEPYILTAEVNGETAKNPNYTLIHLSHESVANSINTLHNKAIKDKDKKIKELEDEIRNCRNLFKAEVEYKNKLKDENDRLKQDVGDWKFTAEVECTPKLKKEMFASMRRIKRDGKTYTAKEVFKDLTK